MAGRRYIPPESLRGERAPPQTSSLAEDRISSNQREIESLLLDNQRLAATHVALKQELSAAQIDLRHLSSTAADVKALKDSQVREVYERSLKMEAEVRSLDALGADLAQVKADVQKLTASKLEMVTKAKAVEGDLIRAKSELQQLPAVEAEIDTMRHHIERGKAAIEYEKKVHASNLEQSQAMEKDMISLTQEIEKLRAELAIAEKRAMAAAAAANPYPGYASGYVNPTITYETNLYPDPYSSHQDVKLLGSMRHMENDDVAMYQGLDILKPGREEEYSILMDDLSSFCERDAKRLIGERFRRVNHVIYCL